MLVLKKFCKRAKNKGIWCCPYSHCNVFFFKWWHCSITKHRAIFHWCLDYLTMMPEVVVIFIVCFKSRPSYFFFPHRCHREPYYSFGSSFAVFKFWPQSENRRGNRWLNVISKLVPTFQLSISHRNNLRCFKDFKQSRLYLRYKSCRIELQSLAGVNLP